MKVSTQIKKYRQMGLVLNFMSLLGLIMPTFTFAVAYFAAIKIERIKSTYALETYEKVVAFSEGQPIEKLTSQKTWKDTMSVVGVPATFLIVLLFSFYVFSLV